MADRSPQDDPLGDYYPGEAPDAVGSWDDAAPAPLPTAKTPAGKPPAARPAAATPAAAKSAAAATSVAAKSETKPAAGRDPAAAPTGQPAAAATSPATISTIVAAEVPAGFNHIEMSAELSILAAILISPVLFDDVVERLVPEDFGVPAHQSMYAAILACDSSGRQFDAITVADEMNRAGTLVRAGGVEYVNRVVTSGPELEHLDSYIDIVIDRSLRRRMVAASRTIGSTAMNPAKDALTALDVAEQTVFELGQKRTDTMTPPMPLVVANLMTEMATARSSKIVGHSTGYAELDRITGGLRGGQLIVLGARPGMGKSVLALLLARHIAEVTGLTVPFMSYEMSQSELGHRLLSAASGIPLSDLMRGYIPQGMERILAVEAEKMAGLPLLLEDQPPPTISGVRSYLRRMARRSPLGAVFVDYVQLLSSDGGSRDENRTQEIGAISRTLKLLAKELDIPVIAVAQLNRGLEQRPNKRPLMSDLRESGSLEQDANLVAYVYRDFVYDKGADETHAELIIAKNRQGPQTTIPLDWDGPCVRFKDTTRTIERGFDAPAAAPAARGGGFGGNPGAANPQYF